MIRSKNLTKIGFWKPVLLMSGVALCALNFSVAPANAQEEVDAVPTEPVKKERPALIITSDPLPQSLRKQIYHKPAKVREIQYSSISGAAYREPMETLVTRKVRDIEDELYAMQQKVAGISSDLSNIQQDNEQKAAEYYTSVATVNTQLQAGTTPGNPRLVKRIENAKDNLDNLASSVSRLNQISMDSAHVASEASFLMDETRAAFSLSGAVEEDHVMLTELEDAINSTILVIERILNNVNDDITRTSTYLSAERNNLRTLSLAVSNGDFYGRNLANRPFSRAGEFIQASAGGSDMSAAAPTPEAPTQLRPLVKIRFDRSNVEFEQPVYLAVNEALNRYPDAVFELVAVYPTRGNAAEIAIESTKARRNAERVLRTLTQMGLPNERVNLSNTESDEAKTNEVHLYVR